MLNKKVVCAFLYTFVASQVTTNLLAAPFNPVTSIDGKEVSGANPVAKIGKTYTVGGVSYTPVADENFHEVGIASWYGDDFHGKLTSNGEVFDMNNLTAAHPTLPLPCFVEVTNLDNGRKIVLRVNDRGPFVSGRVIDLSKRAAQLLGYEKNGTAHVKVQLLSKISKEAVAEINKINMLKNNAIDRLNNDDVKNKITVVKSTVAIEPSISQNLNLNNINSDANDDLSQSFIKKVSLEEPANIKSYIPRGVFVQVGAFSDNNPKIKSHIASLSDIGVVSLHKIDIDGKDVLRVRVGPYGSIDDAIKVKERLTSLGYTLSRVVVEQ